MARFPFVSRMVYPVNLGFPRLNITKCCEFPSVVPGLKEQFSAFDREMEQVHALEEVNYKEIEDDGNTAIEWDLKEELVETLDSDMSLPDSANWWMEKTDKEGLVFYFNEKTGQESWESPK